MLKLNFHGSMTLTSMMLDGEAGGIENIVFSNQNGSVMDVNYGSGNEIASCNTPGDINGDEAVDVIDIIELLNIILGN